jgi:hypothetical protein
LALADKINVLPKLYFGTNYNLVGPKFWSKPYSGQDNNLDQTVFGQNYILAITIFDQYFILAGTRIWPFWPINVLAQTMFGRPSYVLAITIFWHSQSLTKTIFWPAQGFGQLMFWHKLCFGHPIFSLAHR